MPEPTTSERLKTAVKIASAAKSGLPGVALHLARTRTGKRAIWGLTAVVVACALLIGMSTVLLTQAQQQAVGRVIETRQTSITATMGSLGLNDEEARAVSEASVETLVPVEILAARIIVVRDRQIGNGPVGHVGKAPATVRESVLSYARMIRSSWDPPASTLAFSTGIVPLEGAGNGYSEPDESKADEKKAAEQVSRLRASWLAVLGRTHVAEAKDTAEDIWVKAREITRIDGNRSGDGYCVPPSGGESQATTGSNSGGPTVDADTGILTRARPYVEALKKASRVSGIPASFLAAQIQAESGFNPNARSDAGAIGIAQFMPATWERFGRGKAPTDADAAIDAQGRLMHYLRGVTASLPEPDQATFAAYNAGEGAMAIGRVIANMNSETRNYVPKIYRLQKTFAPLFGEKPGQAWAPIEKTEKPADSPSDPATGGEAFDGCSDGVAVGNVTYGGKGDDYPFKGSAHCQVTPSGQYIGGCPPATPLGGLPRECVDFASWRVNQRLGGSTANIKFRSPGNGADWGIWWRSQRWPYIANEHGQGVPKPGDIVWDKAGWKPGDGRGAVYSQYGHVAVVKSVDHKKKTYIEAGYNMLPRDHVYYEIERSWKHPTAYLRLKEKK